MAGSSFTLQADSDDGYDGTPLIDNSKLEAHAGAIAQVPFRWILSRIAPPQMELPLERPLTTVKWGELQAAC